MRICILTVTFLAASIVTATAEAGPRRPVLRHRPCSFALSRYRAAYGKMYHSARSQRANVPYWRTARDSQAIAPPSNPSLTNRTKSNSHRRVTRH